jgi:hypothetical protein
MLAIFTMFLFLGVGHVLHYSEKVRMVEFLRISAGGAMCGAAIVGIIGCCLVFTGRLRLADKKPPEEQPPLPEKNRGDLING